VVKEIITKCNECGSTDEVEEFTITRGGEKREVDLCGDHKGPLVKVFELGEDAPKVTHPRKGRRGSHSVVAIEDLGIEPK
jgi:hypothetical protein